MAATFIGTGRVTRSASRLVAEYSSPRGLRRSPRKNTTLSATVNDSSPRRNGSGPRTVHTKNDTDSRLRRSVSSPGQWSSSDDDDDGDNNRVKDNFGGLFVGSENIQINPEACIPLVNVRAICQSGVARLVAAFEGRVGIPGHSRGHSSAGGLPVVVEISKELCHLVVEYWMQQGASEADAQAKTAERGNWYGIVDGAHRHAALLLLIRTRPDSFKGYKWWVTKINSASIQTLKAFACSRNEFQRKDHIVDFTIYDVLSNMREVAVTLAIDRGAVMQRGKKLPHGFIKDLADTYCGGKDQASETIRQLAGVVVKLSQEVIEAIGQIVNEKSPETAREVQVKKNKGKKTKGATKFLTTREEVDRINALHRVKFLASEYNYKGTPREILEQQVERAIAARLEAEKFEAMLETEQWPEGMTLFKQNLLTTTKLDTEVERNEGNDNVLLPSAEKVYKELYKSTALHRIQAWYRRFESTRCSPRRTSGGTRQVVPDDKPSSDDIKIQEQQHPAVDEDCVGDQVSQEIEDTTEQPVEPCLEAGIQTFQMKFDAFDARALSEDGYNPFDFILGDPGMTGCFPGDPAKGKVVIDDKAMNEFAQFSCRTLVPGGYLFIFTTTEYYQRWELVLSSRGFEVMPNPFVIMRDSDTVQTTNSRKWPQHVTELAIVARTSGEHPKDFQIDLKTPYIQVPKNAHKRKFAAITSAPAPSSRLTRPNRRSLIRPNERAPQLISEIITTFCPPGGRVLDPFANVFTTGIECLATERPCTLLETDPECFEVAKERLDKLAGIRCREIALSPEERTRKKKRAMTTPEEVESLNILLQAMNDTSIEDAFEDNEQSNDDEDQATQDLGSYEDFVDNENTNRAPDSDRDEAQNLSTE